MTTTDLYRDNRDVPSLCVTCAGQNDRDNRDTPLGGVTAVTLARLLADLVPMPRLAIGVKAAMKSARCVRS